MVTVNNFDVSTNDIVINGTGLHINNVIHVGFNTNWWTTNIIILAIC